jgi:NADPH-dependent 2,4-dienoyl-CoA reductase/sulfur reductase-like enzyme
VEHAGPGAGRSRQPQRLTLERIVVVGAGLAGLRAAETLRRDGFSGELVLLGDEPHRPYDRPPLSKQYLAGAWDMDRVWLRIEEGIDFDLRLGVAAASLDIAAGELTLADGVALAFDGLILATGATPRTLLGFDDAIVLRTLDHCQQLKGALQPGKTVAIIGAGFIGLEVASTAVGLGCDVTVIEVLPRPLARVFPAEVGDVLAEVHRDHGVTLMLGEASDTADARGADVVVVGIGVTPATGWLEGSGLTLDNGVVCDQTCAALGGDGRVVAAGDIARWPNPLFDNMLMRIEHWTNAAEQAEAAAHTLLGNAAPFAPVPYFWSDQYDVKVQFVGVCAPDDEFVVLEGSLQDRKFVGGFGRNGRLVGALAFSMPRQLMRYRAAIADRAAFPPPA